MHLHNISWLHAVFISPEKVAPTTVCQHKLFFQCLYLLHFVLHLPRPVVSVNFHINDMLWQQKNQKVNQKITLISVKRKKKLIPSVCTCIDSRIINLRYHISWCLIMKEKQIFNSGLSKIIRYFWWDVRCSRIQNRKSKILHVPSVDNVSLKFVTLMQKTFRCPFTY